MKTDFPSSVIRAAQEYIKRRERALSHVAPLYHVDPGDLLRCVMALDAGETVFIRDDGFLDSQGLWHQRRQEVRNV